MNRKILTTNTGNVLQITLSPFEASVLLTMAAAANLPGIASIMNQKNMYTDVQAVGNTVRNFYNLLEK